MTLSLVATDLADYHLHDSGKHGRMVPLHHFLPLAMLVYLLDDRLKLSGTHYLTFYP